MSGPLQDLSFATGSFNFQRPRGSSTLEQVPSFLRLGNSPSCGRTTFCSSIHPQMHLVCLPLLMPGNSAALHMGTHTPAGLRQMRLPLWAKTEVVKAQGGSEERPGAPLTAQALTAVLAMQGFIGVLNKAHLSLSFSHACTRHSNTTRITQTCVHACSRTQMSADSHRVHGHVPTHGLPRCLNLPFHPSCTF